MNTPSINIKRLQECREKLSITRMEAAKRINVSQSAYVRYELGTRIPTFHVLRTIADVFETSVEYLTDTSDDSTADSYLITKNEDSDLFFIVDTYKHSNSDTQRRLLEYVKKLYN